MNYKKLIILPIFLALSFFVYKGEGIAGSYNYGEALQKSIWFYEAQRSGELPNENRVSWRADSHLNDGFNLGIDLSGGWNDAGDNVKFTFPQASSTTMLSWGALESEEAYINSNQYQYILDNIRWSTDYLLKSHLSENELVVQVGKGSEDHKYWVSAEIAENIVGKRGAFVINASCPGSDAAAETAAALASSSIVFKNIDPDYSQELLNHAEELYSFADTYKGKYSDCIKEKDFDNLYYKSWSGYEDELAWGAAWLYKATENPDYLEKAKIYHESKLNNYTYTHNWDDKSYGTHVLLSQLTGDEKYRKAAEKWLDYWSTGYEDKQIYYTPGGLAWLSKWGTLRYAANTSFIAMVYSDWLQKLNPDNSKIQIYDSFAKSQIDYILGDNPENRSYIVGFGTNPPINVHHRTAHGSWTGESATPEMNRHVIYGALVGGPDKIDNYEDDRSDYVQNEVAVDYNAGLVGALAKLYDDYGGETLEDFPAEEEVEDELFVEAEIVDISENRVQLTAYLNNRTAWPAREYNDLSFRYFLNLESHVDLESLNVNSYYNECSSLSDAVHVEDDIYYVQIDCAGVGLFPYPGGTSKKIDFAISYYSDPNHDFTSDYSYQDLVEDNLKVSGFIPVYSNNELVYGVEPEVLDNTNDSSQDEDTTEDETSGEDDSTNDSPNNGKKDNPPGQNKESKSSETSDLDTSSWSELEGEIMLEHPEDGQEISGEKKIKIYVSGLELDEYTAYYSVDGSEEVEMHNGNTGRFKQDKVLFDEWDWDNEGPYLVTVRAEDLNGNTFDTKQFSVYVKH